MNTAEKVQQTDAVWDTAHQQNIIFDDHAAALEENAAIDRDKTRRQTVANFIDGMVSDMFTPDFETPESKSDFVDLISRIKTANYCFVDGK